MDAAIGVRRLTERLTENLTEIVGSDYSLRGQCEQPRRTITSRWENYHLCRAAAADTETVACMEQQ